MTTRHRRGYDRHRGLVISYRGKADSVYVECECGFSDYVAVWYDKPSPGWDKEQWPKLLRSISIFLASFHEFSKAERVALDVAAGRPVKDAEIRKALVDLYTRKADVCQVLLLQEALYARGVVMLAQFSRRKPVLEWLQSTLDHPKLPELEKHAGPQLKALREIDDLGRTET